MHSNIKTANRRLPSNAGIAIGPILFIIAVLGILASAIAAGSGSFTTGTTNESNRAKAAAMIDIGQNLKIGFDRIVGNGTAFGSVTIAPASTTASTHLFSPTGGGVSAPSVSLAETPSTDTWLYPELILQDIGTGTSSGNGNRVALLKVSIGVCDEINSKANALAAGSSGNGTATQDLGDFTTVGSAVDTTTQWPAALDGKPTGCVYNHNAASQGNYFYQVIGIQ